MIASSTGTGTESLNEPSGGRLRRPGAVTSAIVVATLVALALRLYELARPGVLPGVNGYDEGTYFGSAVWLVHGVLPYRDFIMVQPTGITVLMAPVALATMPFGTISGMAAARVLTALAGAASVPLGGLLVRHRGLLATVVTCGMLAVYPDAVETARMVLLEPWLVLFCLLGTLAVFDGDRLADRGRLIWGGLAFGFAGAVKVWAILPVLVILALSVRRPRQAGVFAVGVAAGFCIPVLPFVVLAPATFYRSVIVAQLTRSDSARTPLGFRLQQMLGLVHLHLPTLVVVVAGVGVIVFIVGLSFLGARLSRQPPPALDLFATISCTLVIVALLWPPDFYNHYAAFLAPFLALAIALSVSRVLGALSGTGVRARAEVGLPRRLTALAVVTLAVIMVPEAAVARHVAPAIPTTATNEAEHAIPSGSCVLTDAVSYTIAINRFVSDVPGCSKMVDLFGSDMLFNGFNEATGPGSVPALVRLWLSALSSAQYVWFESSNDPSIPWTPQLHAYFLAHFVPVTAGPSGLYVRKGQRAG